MHRVIGDELLNLRIQLFSSSRLVALRALREQLIDLIVVLAGGVGPAWAEEVIPKLRAWIDDEREPAGHGRLVGAPLFTTSVPSTMAYRCAVPAWTPRLRPWQPDPADHPQPA